MQHLFSEKVKRLADTNCFKYSKLAEYKCNNFIIPWNLACYHDNAPGLFGKSVKTCYPLTMDRTEAKRITDAIMENVGRVIVGKDEVVRLVLTSLLAGGHVLLEDLPGSGKTVLSKSLAKSLDLPFQRIQATADLLPGDVTGISYFSQKEGDFIFREGPVFTSILLVDEINRTTARTQSSLLEAMEERQVTVDGVTRALPDPFFVIATENPIETAGTYPLPEAQKDRFFMMLSMGFASKDEEVRILQRFLDSSPLEEISPVCTKEEFLEIRRMVSSVYVHSDIMEYIASIIDETRKDRNTSGISTRGTLALLRGSRAYAFLDGRDYVTPDDVKAVAPAVLSHRIMSLHSVMDRRDGERVIERILSSLPVPSERWEK